MHLRDDPKYYGLGNERYPEDICPQMREFFNKLMMMTELGLENIDLKALSKTEYRVFLNVLVERRLLDQEYLLYI